MTRKTLIALALLLVGGCGSSTVSVELQFPREENFLFSDFGRLLVYSAQGDAGTADLGLCPRLLDDARAGSAADAVFDSTALSICAFRDGFVMPSIPQGPHAYLMLARDEANTLLLTGCAVGEVYENAPPIRIAMFPSTNYEDATSTRTLTCGNSAQKCETGCR